MSDHPRVGDEFAGRHRVGGHRLQFYAIDAEIVEWLGETLPETFGPYDVVGQEWQGGRWEPFTFPLDAIEPALKTHRRSANWWIRSQRLSSHVPPGDDKRQSFNGLILVQLGGERNGRIEESSIAVVDRIRHAASGAERRQPEYLQIFERLRRSMRKRLVVATAYRGRTAASRNTGG